MRKVAVGSGMQQRMHIETAERRPGRAPIISDVFTELEDKFEEVLSAAIRGSPERESQLDESVHNFKAAIATLCVEFEAAEKGYEHARRELAVAKASLASSEEVSRRDVAALGSEVRERVALEEEMRAVADENIGMRNILLSLRAEVAQLKTEVAERSICTEAAINENRFLKGRVSSLEAELVEAMRDKDADMLRVAGDISSLRAALDSSRESCEELRARLSRTEASTREAEASSVADLARLTDALEGAMAAKEAAEEESATRSDEMAAMEEKIADLERRIESTAAQLVVTEEQRSGLSQANEDMQAAATQMREEESGLRAALELERERVMRLETELDELGSAFETELLNVNSQLEQAMRDRKRALDERVGKAESELGDAMRMNAENESFVSELMSKLPAASCTDAGAGGFAGGCTPSAIIGEIESLVETNVRRASELNATNESVRRLQDELARLSEKFDASQSELEGAIAASSEGKRKSEGLRAELAATKTELAEQKRHGRILMAEVENGRMMGERATNLEAARGALGQLCGSLGVIETEKDFIRQIDVIKFELDAVLMERRELFCEVERLNSLIKEKEEDEVTMMKAHEKAMLDVMYISGFIKR